MGITISLMSSCSNVGDAHPNYDEARDIRLEKEAVENWISTCEAEPGSAACIESIYGKSSWMNSVYKLDTSYNIQISLPTHQDPLDTRECKENPDGDTCLALRFLEESGRGLGGDLVCGPYAVFGSGRYCWGRLDFLHKGTKPIEMEIGISLETRDKNDQTKIYLSDVEGEFLVRGSPQTFSRRTTLTLNPEGSTSVYFAISIQKLEDFSYLKVYEWPDEEGPGISSIILCLKDKANSYEVYEDAAYLNACKWIPNETALANGRYGVGDYVPRQKD
jgi:hypothetical protein